MWIDCFWVCLTKKEINKGQRYLMVRCILGEADRSYNVRGNDVYPNQNEYFWFDDDGNYACV